MGADLRAGLLSKPGWKTDDRRKLCWDRQSGTLHGVQVNTEGTSAYKRLGGFDPNRPWRLQFDWRINGAALWGGRAIGLFGPDMCWPDVADVAGVQQLITDHGRGTSLAAHGLDAGGGARFDPHLELRTWCRHHLEYDPASGILSLRTRLRSNGELFLEQQMQVSEFSEDMNCLGGSRFHMKGTADSAEARAAVDFDLDNITLSEAAF